MKKICVIEDNAVIRKLFVTIMRKDGYELYDFASGESALNGLPIIMPDLIVMDILLPDINGTELIAKVKAINGLANVPVIAVTGFATEQDSKKFIELGFSSYLSKPVNIPEFTAEVKKLLG
jgi:two-component system cell cycle response regulator DivK